MKAASSWYDAKESVDKGRTPYALWNTVHDYANRDYFRRSTAEGLLNSLQSSLITKDVPERFLSNINLGI
jgi:hypothetical protein